jgi:sulfhydrogenase subunit alpha
MHKTDQLRSFHVEELTRVEGEGALDVVLDGDEIVDLKFKIFESPRFYEAFLRGRDHLEVTDITARICGICPVAYQTSAANAIEQILGIRPSPEILDLRRLLYLGEWIESHALHVYLLHAPDFLGYPGGVELAKDAPDIVSRGLRLKKLGNEIMALVGGREIHPVNPRVGGFWSAPRTADVRALRAEVEWAIEAAIETVDWTSRMPMPDLEVDYEFVALRLPDEYAVIDGTIISTGGIDIAPDDWGEVFAEEHVEWSNALHARIKGRGSYHVGPLARYNLNRHSLHPLAIEAADRHRLPEYVTNPFQSIVVRSVELVHAAATIRDLIDRYRPADPPFITAPSRAGTGHGVSEAPRGLLYHRYRIDGHGLIEDAQIVPPTSQNQLRIEEDLRALIPTIADRDDGEIQVTLEQAIRNYDPCISCATHFLDLRIVRR